MKKFQLFALFFLFTALCIETFPQKKGIYKAELGLQVYTFRNSMPKNMIATLDTIKAMGFTEIESGTPRNIAPESFRKLCDDRGIKIVSTGGGYEQLVKNAQEAANNAKILGAEYLMCAWIPHKKGAFGIEEAKKAVQDFNAIGKTMKENGLTFCYHAHGYEFQKYENGTLLDYIIQNTNPEYVSFEMDVLWITHGGGDPVKLLKKYGNRWKLLHLKDLKKGVVGDLTGGTSADNNVVLGEGQADWKKIIKLSNKLGIKHFFIEDESNKEYIYVPKSVAYLKSL
jgi:sugar phosphate isomerase/epimerase